MARARCGSTGPFLVTFDPCAVDLGRVTVNACSLTSWSQMQIH